MFIRTFTRFAFFVYTMLAILAGCGASVTVSAPGIEIKQAHVLPEKPQTEARREYHYLADNKRETLMLFDPIEHPDAVHVLKKAARENDSPAIRKVAIQGLVKHHFDDSSVMRTLYLALTDEDQDVRQQLYKPLLTFKGNHPAMVPAYIKYLQHYNQDRGSWQYVWHLRNLRATALPAMPVLKELFISYKERGWNDPMMPMLVEALVRIDLTSALNFGEQILQAKVPGKTRGLAAIILGYGDLRHAKILLRYLEHDSEEEVRASACGALGRMAIRSTPKDMRWGVVPTNFPPMSQETWKDIQALSTSALVRTLDKDQSALVRLNAILTLRGYKNRAQLTPRLRKIITDKAMLGLTHDNFGYMKGLGFQPSRLWYVALETLCMFNDPEAARLLIRILKGDLTVKVISQVEAGETLAWIHRPNIIIPVLAKMLPRSDDFIRYSLIIKVLAAQGPTAIPVLEKRLKVETAPYVREDIQEAIQEIKDKRAKSEAS